MHVASRTRPQVVVVEDDPELTRLETEELEAEGFEVRVAPTSAAAVAVARSRTPDCWVIEHRLSGDVSGLQLAALLREAGDGAPVVLIADRRDATVLQQALSAGVRDVVAKGPAFAEFLGFRVRATIERAKTGRCLRDAQARIEAASSRQRATEAFLSMLGRELRNPLAPISNAVEILRLRGERADDVRWAAEVVGRQVAQLRRLVDDLGDVGRVVRGQFQLAFAPTLLRDVVAEAVARCRDTIDARGLRLVLADTHGEPTVYGDAARLEQALVKLIDGIVAFAPERSTLEVALSSRDGEALIVVARKGIALGGEMPSLVRNDELGHHGWLGSGPSLVRRIIELHGGRIEATSDGFGARSTVHLPLSRIAPPADDVVHVVPVALPGRRIVVVDHDADSASSMAMLLQHWGFTVECAHDADSAVQLVADGQPHAVLVDLDVPGDVVARLRDAAGGKPFVLIAVANAGHQDGDLAASAAVDRRVIKPVAATALQDALQELLQP